MKLCIKCLKELPDNWGFCPACGFLQRQLWELPAPVPDPASSLPGADTGDNLSPEAPPLNSRPAVAIQSVELSVVETPVEAMEATDERGFFLQSAGYSRTALRLVVALADMDEKPTANEGTFYIGLESSSDGIAPRIYWPGRDAIDRFKDSYMRNRISREGRLFLAECPVAIESFRTYPGGPPVAYVVDDRLEPLLVSQFGRTEIVAHVWFQLPQGKVLYKAASALVLGPAS